MEEIQAVEVVEISEEQREENEILYLLEETKMPQDLLIKRISAQKRWLANSQIAEKQIEILIGIFSSACLSSVCSCSSAIHSLVLYSQEPVTATSDELKKLALAIIGQLILMVILFVFNIVECGRYKRHKLRGNKAEPNMAPVLGVTLTLVDFALSLYLAYHLRVVQSLYPTEMHIGHFPWFESVDMC